MTRNQWMLVSILAAGVFIEFCLIGALAIRQFKALTAPEVAALVETPTPTMTATPASTFTPTVAPSDTPTATWVIQRYAPRTLPTPHPRVPGPLQDAWDKSSQPVPLRIELVLSAQGDLATFPSLKGYNPQTPLYDLTVESDGKNDHLLLKGFMASFISADPGKGLEMADVGDKVYIHGPVPYLGAPGNKWYVGPRGVVSNSGAVESPDSFRRRNPDWTGFKKTGNQALDGKHCDAYVAGQDATGRFFQDLSPQTLPSQYFDALDNAQTQVWICDDGYMHQLSLTVEAHVPGNLNRKASFTMRFHFYDFGSTIKITAPASADPLEPSYFFDLPQPTPTPTPRTL